MFAVVLGLSPTGLYAIRELGRAGIAVAGVAEGVQCGEDSRYLTIQPVLKAEADPIRLVETLLEMATRQNSRGMLVPTSDYFIEFVVNHRQALSDAFDFPQSYTRAQYDAIVDKGNFLASCRKARIATPQSREVESHALASLGEDMEFPVLIKPTLIHLVKAFMAGRKVLIARDCEELEEIARTIPKASATAWLVQEIVAGPDSNITLFSGYVDRSGKVRQAFTARKLRQYPPGFGSASLVRSETLPETREAAEKLLDALGFQGIAGVEFKTDERSGDLKIIEVNPRPSLWFAAGTTAGRTCTLAALHDFAGRDPLPDRLQKDGVVWRYGLKDQYSALWYRRNGDDFVLPAPDIDSNIGKDRSLLTYAVYAKDDRRPALRELSNFARKGSGRLRSTILGKIGGGN